MALPANHKEVQKNWDMTIAGKMYLIDGGNWMTVFIN